MASPTHQCLWLSLFLLGLCGLHAVSAVKEQSMVVRHEQWMAKHGRQYNDVEEKQERYRVFKANVEFIESFNRNSSGSHRLGVNEFADMTNEEFVARRTGYRASPPEMDLLSEKTPVRYAKVSSLPRRVDWRKRGVVSPVKNQGQCGCCSIFAGVAALEGIIKIKNKLLVSLSEQELLDCDHVGQDSGCNGGTLEGTYEYVVRSGGLSPEPRYPYTGVENACKAKSMKKSPLTHIKGYKKVPFYDEEALLQAVAHQPVSVALDGQGHHFQFYSGGILSGDCGTKMTHAITIVGYGETKKGKKFWIAKNSWGERWGEKGFVRMLRGVNSKEGMCGIYTAPVYPTF